MEGSENDFVIHYQTAERDFINAEVSFGLAGSACFVTGHDFSRAARSKKERALAPVMARPERNSSQEETLNPVRTFFATANANMGKNLFQSERNAGLFIEVLRELMTERKFELHDFVVMPDHVHLL